MSWTRVQAKTAATTNVSSQSATFNSSVTAGNLIVAGLCAYTPGAVTVKDSINNVNYSQAAAANNAGTLWAGIFWYVAPLGGSGFTVTETSTNSCYPALFISEWNYTPAATISLDGAQTATGGYSATSVTTASITITGPDLVYALAAINTGETWTAGSGFTLGSSVTQSGGQHVGGQEEYALNQAAGSVTPSISFSNADGSGGVAFAAAAFNPSLVVPYWYLFAGANLNIRDTP